MIDSPLPQIGATLALANPFAATDRGLAAWFHGHLNATIANFLHALSEPGSGEWIGIVLFVVVAIFLWKRAWVPLLGLVIAVPGGMLLNELVKLAVHRQRPYLQGPFVDWSGYSFASGHTIGATLLYGQLLLIVLPLLKSRRTRQATILMSALVVALVGFSRIALGAHYFTDVIGAIILGIVWLALCGLVIRPVPRKSSTASFDIVLVAGQDIARVPVTLASSQKLV